MVSNSRCVGIALALLCAASLLGCSRKPAATNEGLDARIERGKQLCAEADRLLADGKNQDALKVYKEVLAILPASPRAKQGIEQCSAQGDHRSGSVPEPSDEEGALLLTATRATYSAVDVKNGLHAEHPTDHQRKAAFLWREACAQGKPADFLRVLADLNQAVANPDPVKMNPDGSLTLWGPGARAKAYSESPSH